MTWADGLAPLRERNFAWYFASRFVNTLGSMMATIALTFAVLDLTDSAAALGQVLAAHTIPMIVLLLWGGVISDRLPAHPGAAGVQRRLGAHPGRPSPSWCSPGRAELWMLIVLTAVHGAVSAISFPAMASMVPQLVPRSQLQPANALLSLTRNGLTVLGPTTGALLVVTIGSGWALAVDAAMWLLSALLLLPVRMPARERKQSSSTIAELREGWQFFWSTTWLWAVVLGFGALNMIHNGALLHPRTRRRPGHHRPPGLGLRALRRGGRPARDGGRHAAGAAATAALLGHDRHRLRAVPMVMLGVDPTSSPSW